MPGALLQLQTEPTKVKSPQLDLHPRPPTTPRLSMYSPRLVPTLAMKRKKTNSSYGTPKKFRNYQKTEFSVENPKQLRKLQKSKSSYESPK